MIRNSIRAIIIAFILPIFGIAVAPVSASAATGDIVGSITSVDGCEVQDRKAYANYQNNLAGSAYLIDFRSTDVNGVTSTSRSLVAGPSSVVYREYAVSALPGTGPWTVELIATLDDLEYFTLDTDTVSVCEEPPPVPEIPNLIATATGTCEVTVVYEFIDPPFTFSVKGKKMVNVVDVAILEPGVVVYDLALTGAPSRGGKANIYDLTVSGGGLSDKVVVYCLAA